MYKMGCNQRFNDTNVYDHSFNGKLIKHKHSSIKSD